MKTYILTSQRFAGEIQFKFDLNDSLIGFEIQAELDEKQTNYFFNNLPRTLGAAVAMTKNPGATMKLELMPQDLSFDVFYNQYGYKVGKQQAETQYKKLSDADKHRVIMSIRPYKRYLTRTGVAQVWPERFISRKYFETDWNKA
ncbi:MAG: hypothetical protein F9K23_00810 [Bacteroidetes bacterium]|nr:MAG: hypothetical protein F9K23_00810 [Bacteroidota bacterium]